MALVTMMREELRLLHDQQRELARVLEIDLDDHSAAAAACQELGIAWQRTDQRSATIVGMVTESVYTIEGQFGSARLSSALLQWVSDMDLHIWRRIAFLKKKGIT
jgi:hypothetical protein